MNTQVLSWARPAARDRAVVNYYSGRMDTTLPFDEFRRRSLINEAARRRLDRERKAVDDKPPADGDFHRAAA